MLSDEVAVNLIFEEGICLLLYGGRQIRVGEGFHAGCIFIMRGMIPSEDTNTIRKGECVSPGCCLLCGSEFQLLEYCILEITRSSSKLLEHSVCVMDELLKIYA